MADRDLELEPLTCELDALRAERDSWRARAQHLQTQMSSTYKSQFLSLLSHELRTPLNGIMGYASMLKEEPSVVADPGQSDGIQRILKCADRMRGLVDDMLDVADILARRFVIQRDEVNFADMLTDIVADMQGAAALQGARLLTHCEVTTVISCDGPRIGQVLRAMIDNALRFTEGGTVVVHAMPNGAGVLTRVTDSGAGIAPQEVERLFEPFHQVDMSTTRIHGGAGLGLALCKGIIEAHGGTVGAMSVAGRGNTFWFVIP